MKKILLGMASIVTLSAAIPAAAQYPTRYPDQNPMSYGFDVRIGHLETRLQAGVQQGTITLREARPLRLQLRELARLERLYSLNGLTRQERGDLQQRFRILRQQIRVADNGGYDRYDRDDRYSAADDRYGRDIREDRIDRNGDGWDDRDRDRDGRRDDGMADARSDRIDANRDGFDDRDFDRDGRWEDDRDEARYQPRDNRGLVERMIDGTIGGGLRVGQRASADLSAVPYEYRGQYRDSGNSYYRSDGRAIYQIDARTHTVVRIYALNR
jgi:hypothetical protein